MVNIFEFFEAIPTWMKWTGGSFIVVFIFLLIVISQPGGEEVVKAPVTIKEATNNATAQLVNEGVKASTTVAGEIISTFDKTGEEIAKQVPDKTVGAQIHFLWIIAGLFLTAIVVIMIMKPILEIASKLNHAFG